MTEESAVKVCVRVRPLIAREESAAAENTEPVQLFWKADKRSIHLIDDGTSTKNFSFDRVFTAEETTSQLYQDIAKPLVVSSVEGYNGTIFAYGQTSSGKTFTMMGGDHIPGVIPLAVEDVFQTIKNCPKKEFLLRVSYMEIYNETVTDLLVDSWKRKPLEVRETINKNIYVADLTEELVTSPAQALAWIRKGEKNRHYGKTKMNQRSSRSHTIFRMILESRERSDPASGENADGAIIVSHLNLVDLAGSERASQTGAEGTRFKEGCNINRSLFTLGQVIKKLTDEGQKGFTNYRDSKLTRILQNSLGGNAKTVIICTITPVTLDETLSTLQFASTAKKMKNDPHVTEVSDDGALLKRYRNEIVDLKRRLHEVSSVTQTTATEKEVLSQLLQEKDQLQREQEDRIRNLTKLLVTSSNPVPVQKMPKRRVTWGGKMLRLARPSACGGGSSDLSFAEPLTRKRKADRSCLMELGEDDEDFDSHWEIPDEPSDEMDMSQSSVTVRSFEDSPKDYLYPDRMRELSGKVSTLELQLEMESKQKEEAMTKVETLDGRMAELEVQLQMEAQQKQEALEKIQTAEQKAAELQLQLQTEAQQKQEATEKGDMLEIRIADLERQLEEQGHTQNKADEQMRREFAETIQLCETLAAEKDMVVGERDYLKQELGMFIEQISSLEKENAALSQELDEKRETDEFKSLEEEFRKEHENELQNEISSLKKAVESSELQHLELQNKLETLSEELKKKSDFAEELQNMSGKDLVQEVAKLRRSLDDAEGLSRDTKKDWAVLRSQNITLEEKVVTLTASHEKMDAEVNSLRFQLETEKSRYKKMQSDLQKELNVVFDENTKLTTLLDGKVPKNLIDGVELERTVANLNKELTASREAEGALRAQLEDRMETLQAEMWTLTEKLQSAEAERDKLLCEKEASGQTSTEEAEKLLSRVTSLSEERDELQEALEALRQEKQQLRAQLEDRMEMAQCELQQQLSSEPQSLKEEQEAQRLLQIQQLEEHLEKSKEELNQLKSDLQENVELMIENQEELRVSQENIRVLQDEITTLRSQKAELEGRLSRGGDAETTIQTQELQNQIQTLTEEFERVRAERDGLMSDRKADAQTHGEQVEKLLSRVTSLGQERDELLETLEALRQEKQQLRAELEDRMETLQAEMWTLTEKLQSAEAERDKLLCEKEASGQTSTEEAEKLLSRVTSLGQERDELQEALEALRQEKQQLRAQLEDRMEMISAIQQKASEQEKLNVQQQAEREEQETKLQQEMQQLEQQLQTYREKQTRAEAEAETSQQLLSDANTSISALREQLSSLSQSTSGVKGVASSRLQDSTGQLQEGLRKFQQFVDTCSKYKSSVLDKALKGEKHTYLTSLPKATMNAYSSVCQLGLQTVQSLGNIVEHLQVQAQVYRNLFGELVKKDLAVFEERRLQDVLLCRAQASSYSVKDEDFQTLWEHRLTELLDKRQLYLQKMVSISEKLWANMAHFPSELSAEVGEREKFKEQLQAAFTTQPINFTRLDGILSRELERRSAVIRSWKTTLQGNTDDHNGLCQELKLLEAQADSQLREERSKSSTLLRGLEGAPVKKELSLLKDNQQLVLKLQQSEEQVRALRAQNGQLEEAQIKANSRVSNQKQATQLLQTELQDSRAQVQEREDTIQTLRSKLRESEKNASPSTVELEKLRTKLFKVEVELSSASDKHQQEIQRMTTLLNEKEESLRKLKETLRKSQQHGEESFLQGEDLHARLTNPRGLLIKSSVVLEKTKLEEEVQQLQMKIIELESLVSSQQAEISKWKNRAIKLKVKNKAEVDKPSSPCTPTKRGLPMTSDSSNFLNSPKKFVVTPKKALGSPRKLQDSPKVSLLDSPKSRFFDMGGTSEMLSRTCPKQFFDNSSLGTIPEVSHVPDTPDAEKDAAVGADRKDEWWPQSPKQDEMCKTQ
uniref:centromere-associated protein E isoform X5 n=1 Tax=Scatophagus argus TaxID=75038 RepID=UPI001ED7E96C|nr:centromere-associated protein E isoform X5 [Scatophagus argus]